MKLLCLTVSVALTIGVAQAQFIEIKDPAEGVDLDTYSSMAEDAGQENWVTYKGQIYFIAASDLTGPSIYRTDGTSEGTVIAMDLPDDMIVVTGLAVAGDNLFFLATNGDGPALGLYVCDGTQDSEEKLGNMNGYNANGIGPTASMDGVLYFTARDDEHGYEPWRSDGTEAGTFMLKDIIPGQQYSAPFGSAFQFYRTDNYIFFTAMNDAGRLDMWRTDGAKEGTIQLTDFGSEHGIQFNAISSNSSSIYFVTYSDTDWYDMWSSDGTLEGTSLFKDDAGTVIYTGEWNNKIFYSTLSDELFVIEDDEAVKIADVQGKVNVAVEFKGLLYFLDNTSGLWRTDGTEEGTEKTNANASGNYVGLGANSDFVIMTTGYPVTKLYAYDGENPDLEVVTEQFEWAADHNSGDVIRMNVYEDKFFLVYNDLHHGIEPWISDGTSEGTFMLKDIQPKPTIVATINDLTSAGSKIFFRGNDGIHGDEPWVSDGTHDGTFMLKDINPGIDGSGGASLDGRFTALNEIVIFSTSPTTTGARVWRSDGTVEGTYPIAGGNSIGNSILYQTITVGDQVYYDDGFSIWKTDGTEEGTIHLKDLSESTVLYFGALKQTTVLFVVGKTLWKSDGTEDGTVVVKELPILPASYSSYEQHMFSFGDITLFVADNGSNGTEIWKTDGTEQGTQKLKGGLPQDIPHFHGVVGGKVLFESYNQEGHGVLWATDGTASGTTILKDLGSNNFFHTVLGTDGTNLFFATRNNQTQTVWKTDGTTDGTKQSFGTPGGFYAEYMVSGVSFNDRFFFEADSDDTGWELWATNLTEVGTKPLELLHGPASSYPHEILNALDNLFFVARDESAREKLFMFDPNYVFKLDQTIDFENIPDKKSTDAPFELHATASSGLPVSFEIVSGPATVDGSTLTITGVGTVTVNATQAGNDDYNPAFEEQSFNVDLFDGVEDEFASIRVWPNPATGTLIIDNLSASVEATLKDIVGRAVVTIRLNQQQTSIDVNHLPRGMYIIELKENNDKLVSKKVVLK